MFPQMYKDYMKWQKKVAVKCIVNDQNEKLNQFKRLGRHTKRTPTEDVRMYLYNRETKIGTADARCICTTSTRSVSISVWEPTF